MEVWQMAFLPILNRMQSLFGGGSPAEGETSAVRIDPDKFQPNVAPVMEIYTDFLIFGYHFYADLLDEAALPKEWLPAWEEALGEIALHRVSVLELQSEAISSALPEQNGSGSASSQAGPSSKATAKERKSKQKAGILRPPQQSKASKGAGRSELEDADSPAGNSIGTAALNDWVLQEEEIWRKIAREWFFRAVHAEPGNGRLHARLAKSWKNDAVLQRLYHLERRSVLAIRRNLSRWLR